MKKGLPNFYPALGLCLLTMFFMLNNSQGFSQIPSGYYDAASGKTGSDLKSTLNTIISGHTTISYDACWDALKETDVDPTNAANVIGLYSNFSMDGAAEYASAQGWNREHVWAKSRGDFGTSQGAGTDLHHLRAEDVSTNSARNNRNFDYATTLYTDQSGNYQGSTDSKTSSTEWTWEPRDEVKGDVARMMFYMATRYEGANGEPDLELTETHLSNTDKSPVHSKLSVLLAWHAADPVSAAEITRNNVIYSNYQFNRNPFIDHPEYVCAIYTCGAAGNNAPYFTSTASTSIQEGSSYSYNVLTTDLDGDSQTITGTTIPSWLTLNDNGNGTATLNGTPTNSDIGSHVVVLSVSDGTDNGTQSFTINVTSIGGGTSGASDLIISEYIEGASYNKGIEIANFTGSTVNLADYSLFKQSNGAGSWGSELALSGSLEDGEAYTIAHTNSNAAMLGVADLITSASFITFNGNDPVALFKNGTLIDMVGTLNNTSNFAQNTTLVRSSTTLSPNATYSTTEWTSYNSDTFSYFGSHDMDVVAPDTEAPTTPTGLSAANVTETSVNLSWTASTDNIGVIGYKVYQNGSLVATEATPSSAITGLTAATNYTFTISALDEAGNVSTLSSGFGITTASPVATSALFISEYIEGSSYNKAIEIANLSGSTVNLSGYSLMKQTNGAGAWNSEIALSGLLADRSVFVITHSSAHIDLLAQSDLTNGELLSFNGNDAVGLFKDGQLVDVIGVFDGGSTNFAANQTLVRKSTIAEANDSFDLNEWDVFTQDTFLYLGGHNQDIEAPTAPSNLMASNIAETSFDLSWGASTDNMAVSQYIVSIDGNQVGTTAGTLFTAGSLIANTTYNATIEAIDEAGNQSSVTAINVTTLAIVPTEVVLIESYFESGFGSWADGGSDAAKYSGSRSPEGNGSIKLRDNSGVASAMTSSTIDVSHFDAIELSFEFYVYSMESNEDFFVSYYDGSNWVTLSTYVSGSNISNNSTYAETISFTSQEQSFPNNAQFRFQCDASGNGDHIYIDAVVVKGTNNSSSAARQQNELILLGTKEEAELVTVYPNPVNGSDLNVQIYVEEIGVVNVSIFNLQGQLQISENIAINAGSTSQAIDASELSNGIYFLQVTTEDAEVEKRKVIVSR